MRLALNVCKEARGFSKISCGSASLFKRNATCHTNLTHCWLGLFALQNGKCALVELPVTKPSIAIRETRTSNKTGWASQGGVLLNALTIWRAKENVRANCLEEIMMPSREACPPQQLGWKPTSAPVPENRRPLNLRDVGSL